MTRTDLIVLGRKLGTYEKWDEADAMAVTFYNFEPAEGVRIPACASLFLSWDNGSCIAQDRDGEPMGPNQDLATLCASLPRR